MVITNWKIAFAILVMVGHGGGGGDSETIIMTLRELQFGIFWTNHDPVKNKHFMVHTPLNKNWGKDASKLWHLHFSNAAM